ncbi:hypothetical protein DFJ63DRAFT_314340 [Scheffersomyces coipomensis]|uniref:uncharacterized protein n=1 Tax=Scheffersomyces coipomensis TaxID=1788519 RepID=UPI00315C7DF3
MSELSRRLGPQGRELLQSHGSGSNFDGPGSSATPQDLDYLIDELRNPKSDTTIKKVLGYLYHYLPYVKHEHNLRILFSSFLNTPVCFGQSVVPFESNYMIIEVFKLITDKKLKISQPTLSIKSFYTVILKELTNFVAYNPIANSWKVLPIITGILLSNQLRDDLYVIPNVFEFRWFFSDWDKQIKQLFQNSINYSLSHSQPEDVVDLSLVSLALTYNKDENIHAKVSLSFIIQRLVHLLFISPQNSTLAYLKLLHLDPLSKESEQLIQEEILQKPIIKHLNKLSFLLEACFKSLKFDLQSYELIMNTLDILLTYDRQLNHISANSDFNHPKSSADTNPIHQQFWYIMKNIFFSQIIIIQGILTRFLTANAKSFPVFNPFRRNISVTIEQQYHQISLKILSILYYSNFILLSIGQGGFDNYNFVYYLTLELSLSSLNTNSNFENSTKYLISNYQEINYYPNILNNNYIMRSKVLFSLGLWENYLQKVQSHPKKNDKFINNDIFNITFNLVDDNKYNDDDLIEASHSVLLFCFSNNEDADINKFVEYVKILFLQFPRRISSHQLSIAVETIGKKILSNPFQNGVIVENFLHFIYEECQTIRPGIKIAAPHSTTSDIGFASAQPIQEISAESTLRTLENNNDTDSVGLTKEKAEYQFEKRLIPDTSREAAIVSFIALVPYLPLSIFLKWVDKIWLLIVASNPAERDFLVSILWKSLSENLDVNRVELAIRWWYDIKGLPETSPFKLEPRL